MELEFRLFDTTHFSEYCRWYAHPSVRRALGYIDKEWLEHVLNDDQGREYAVFQQNELVAEVGLMLPTESHPAVAITNLSVKPGRQRQGIGSAVLRELRSVLKHQQWVAYASIDNPGAQAFLKKNGWVSRWPPNSEGMIQYTNHCVT
ncbi:MAG: GNAT family N-acetyltransferase [Tunicatimonas sp.]